MCNFVEFEEKVYLGTTVLQVLMIMIVVIAFFLLMTLCSYICGYLSAILQDVTSYSTAVLTFIK
jgi:hypothetical protein